MKYAPNLAAAEDGEKRAAYEQPVNEMGSSLPLTVDPIISLFLGFARFSYQMRR
jgi:hypothetical protein